MKRTCSGWAVIFAVTVLLFACSSSETQVSQADTPSDPDATIAQTESSTEALGMQAIEGITSMTLLDQRALQLDQREVDLEWSEDELSVARARVAELERQLRQREVDLEFCADEMAVLQSGFERRRAALDQQEIDLEWRADAIAEQRSGLAERAAQIAQREGLAAAAAQFVAGGGRTSGPEPGRCYAHVTVPGEYLTVADKMLVRPARSRLETLPARYETVGEKVRIGEGETAEYKTVLVTRMIEPARTEQVEIPAQYQTVTKRVKVTEDRMEWQEILCASEMTEARVRAIQQSLAQAGFDPGPIDGFIGARTMTAVNAFQEANALRVAGYLTIETVEALGLNP